MVLEKPIGKDLARARAINNAVGAVFDERQIYRIDHYLGKETVQNLMALRFANSLFEPLWNSRAHRSRADHRRRDASASRARGGYYDAGRRAARHGAEPHAAAALPRRDGAAAASMAPTPCATRSSRCCARCGRISGSDVLDQRRARPVHAPARSTARRARLPATRSAHRAAAHRDLRRPQAEIDNWRWAGVPFYLRTGKRLPRRVSEIVIQFRTVPHSIFDRDAGRPEPNRLVIRLQPDEGVQLQLMSKDPGPGGMRLKRRAARHSPTSTPSRRAARSL